MYYRKFAPSLHIAPFVECYFVWERNQMQIQPLRIESPPTGFVSIMFNYVDVYQVGNSKYESPVMPFMFLIGQATQSYTLDLSGRIGVMGIAFKLADLSSLFGLPMYKFTDERVNLSDVLGKPLVWLYEQILEAHYKPMPFGH